MPAYFSEGLLAHSSCVFRVLSPCQSDKRRPKTNALALTLCLHKRPHAFLLDALGTVALQKYLMRHRVVQEYSNLSAGQSFLCIPLNKT